jgi:PhnB protein
MISASPYLNFPGNTEEAFNYYKSVFGGEFTNITRFRDMGNNSMGVPESDLDKIANVGLPLGKHTVLMGTDSLAGWKPLTMGNNFYITIEVDSSAEADRLFANLSDAGHVEMPLQPTEWAEKYGCCADRFGVQWMVMYTGSVQFGGDSRA